MVCMGLKLVAAGCKAQTNPLSYVYNYYDDIGPIFKRRIGIFSPLKGKSSHLRILMLAIVGRCVMIASVTRLGGLLPFGKLFKACGNNYFAQIAHIFMQFL